MDYIGLSTDRFVDEKVESFSCVICSDVVINPKMCEKCNHIFCGNCIDEWLKTNKICPFRCHEKDMEFMVIPPSVKKLYGELRVVCSKGCETVVCLKDLFKHENSCGICKCDNYEKCQKNAPLLLLNKRVCSEKCFIYLKYKDGEKIEDNLLCHLLQNFAENITNEVGNIQTFHCFWNSPNLTPMKDENQVKIDEENQKGLKIQHKESSAINSSTKKCFKSAVGAYAVMEGAQYFEIKIKGSSKGFKVGVVRNQDFNLDGSFCDSDQGYAYFSKGQLRHSSDSMGVKYGEACKSGDNIIGVFVNVNRGQIGFTINGKFQGIAFEGDELKEGPFYPAVSVREGGSAEFLKMVSNPDDILAN